MTNLIEQAREKRDRLAAEIEQLDAMIARHDKVISDLAQMMGANTAPSRNADVRDTPLDTTSVETKRGPNGSPPEQIVRAAILAVENAERPMTRYELVEAVERQGLVIGGNDKARNMGTILWRSGQFVNGGDGYWPKDSDPPPPAEEPSDKTPRMFP